MLVDGLTLTFPVTLVAYDVLQVFVALDIVAAYNVAGILDDLLRNTCLTGYLDGKRRAWLTNRQLEQRLHLMTVVEHGSVHHSRMVLGKVFQILIMGGDDAKSFFLPKLFQHSFSNGTANGRLCTASEFVYQQQRMTVGLLHHVLHVQQMTRIGTQVVGYRLLVANVYHDVLE